jgi:hypothetical protein
MSKESEENAPFLSKDGESDIVVWQKPRSTLSSIFKSYGFQIALILYSLVTSGALLYFTIQWIGSLPPYSMSQPPQNDFFVS